MRTAVSLSEAAALLRHAPPDLVVLDLGLPDGDGAALVREMRGGSAMPIIVVSARHQEAQKIELLDAGADDYLTKPFSVGELLARIRVALRHRGTSGRRRRRRVHALDDLRVDLEARTRCERDGAAVHLTPTEFKLLARLVRSAGRVVTHRQLLADVWGAEFTDAHALPAPLHGAICGPRSKPTRPSRATCSPRPGVGYRLADEVSRGASLCVPDALAARLQRRRRHHRNRTWTQRRSARPRRAHAGRARRRLRRHRHQPALHDEGGLRPRTPACRSTPRTSSAPCR